MNPGLLFLLFLCAPGFAQTPPADDPLVDLATVDDTILVELRYATERNIAGKALYPPGARCIVRRHVAEGLKVAQAWLRPQGYALKIWDAYRPVSAQQALWELSKNRSFVAAPDSGRSIHTWGAAVDATLVDATGKEMKMPTDFDDFSPAAAKDYRGNDTVIARNLSLLQKAMGHGGFLAMRTEWWHFIGKQWRACKPVQVDSMLAGKDGRWSPPPPPRAVIALPTVPAPPAADSPPAAIPSQQPGK
jgi:D-alanyl-D-alanine dipeptidase